MNCLGCGLPMEASEMAMNFKGEKVECHDFQAKCVELLRAELGKKDLQVEELQNKLGSLQQVVCKECKGGGEIGLADGEVPCPTCGGSGDPLHPGVFTIKRFCDGCSGDGHFIDEVENLQVVCGKCGGKGKV